MTLFYDTETQGIPKYGERSTHPDQPHLVEIAGILVDANWNIVDTFHAVVRPMGWRIPANVTSIHGITEAFASEHGIPEEQALEGFLKLARRARLRVAYNEQFDARILKIAITRYCPDELRTWEPMAAECAMRLTQKLIGGRVPTLFESYEAIMGKRLKQQHTAMGDAQACMEVFRELVKGGQRHRAAFTAQEPARKVGKVAKFREGLKSAFQRP